QYPFIFDKKLTWHRPSFFVVCDCRNPLETFPYTANPRGPAPAAHCHCAPQDLRDENRPPAPGAQFPRIMSRDQKDLIPRDSPNSIRVPLAERCAAVVPRNRVGDINPAEAVRRATEAEIDVLQVGFEALFQKAHAME